MQSKIHNIRGAFLGLVVADALGVPVESKSRDYLRSNPVTDMIDGGIWDQAAYTWSDDSSMTLVTAEALLSGYNLEAIGYAFTLWMNKAIWTAHNEVFDIGATTCDALNRLVDGVSPLESGSTEIASAGNGSLMRVLPGALYFSNYPKEDLKRFSYEISGITHNQLKTNFSCFFYSLLVKNILEGHNKAVAFKMAQESAQEFINSDKENNKDSYKYFFNILSPEFINTEEARIKSTGYVIDSLEAAVWAFLRMDNFRGAVLRAVNLGGDTDTIASITGGLAGLYYGENDIPKEWLQQIPKVKEIESLANTFQEKISKRLLVYGLG